MRTRTIIEYILAALIVLILGALAGWYFFLRTQTVSTAAESAARGYGTAAPSGAVDGSNANVSSSNTNANPTPPQEPQASTPPQTSFLSRLWNSLTRRSAGVSEPSSSLSFGESAATLSDTAAPQTNTPSDTAARPSQLWKIQGSPVAGFAFVQTGTNTRLRFVERSSGYVFDADPETGSVVRLTNTLMPKIYEALLTENGHVIARSLAGDDITTFAGSVPTSTPGEDATPTARSLLGTTLVKNITRIATDPKSGALFYIVKNAGGIVGIRSEWNGTKEKQVFQSTLINWRPLLLEDGRTILVQAALDSTPGYAFELKNDGSLTALIGATPGLTVLPREGGGLLWSSSSGGVLSLFVQVSASATSVQLPIQTLPEKCVWSSGKVLLAYCGVPQGLAAQNFLDDWYRGAGHSSDAIWRIDAAAGNAELVYTPPTSTSLDVEKPAIDSGGNYISFTNAADKSLWLLRLVK